jgi:sporulation protein YlmC with PRC-barrel domain
MRTAMITLAMLCTTPAFAQTPTPPPTNMQAPAGGWYNARNDEMRAGKMIGAKVTNTAGEAVGEVNEILLNDGRVVALVVGVGGFLGLGEREVAIAPDGYRIARDSAGNTVITVNATREALKSAPVWQGMRN